MFVFFVIVVMLACIRIDSNIYGKIKVIIGESVTATDGVQCGAMSVLGVKYG
jgi:hypothetical protein